MIKKTNEVLDLSTMNAKHPTILWAQRSPHVYLTVEVEDMKITEMSINGSEFKIRGTKGDESYQADLKFYAKLKGDERRQVATDRHVELIIPKEKTEWWPRLLQEKAKVPWIKVDFNKWVDEDEENANGEEEDFGGMMPPGMGGMDFSSLGMPGMGGMGGANGLSGMNFDDMGDEDEDDETGELEDIVDKKEGENASDSNKAVPADEKKDVKT